MEAAEAEEWADEETTLDPDPRRYLDLESVTAAPEERTPSYPPGAETFLSRMTRVEPEHEVTPLPVVFPEGEILSASHAAEWLARHRDQALICWRVQGRTFRLFRGGKVTELMRELMPVSVCSVARRCRLKGCPMCAVAVKRRWWHWLRFWR